MAPDMVVTEQEAINEMAQNKTNRWYKMAHTIL
jgi:hypothetical protein